MIWVLLRAEGAASATSPDQSVSMQLSEHNCSVADPAKGIQHGYPPALPGVSLPMRDYYRIECYTAERKRTLGHCCLPILL